MSAKTKNFDLAALESLEANLRAGQTEPIKKVLEEIRYQKIARPLIVKVANLARRVGYQRYAIRLLNPIVRPQKPIIPPASPEEQVEYAVNLMRVGVVGEALKILSSVDLKKNPEALLFKAFCLFNYWDYGTAIPLLEKYLNMDGVSAYQKLVAQTNLASAYIIETDFIKAEKVLKEILSVADPKSQKLLVGYTHQLYSELAINRGRAKEAEEHIELAKEFLREAHYRYAVYEMQWTAVTKMLTPRTLKDGKRLLRQVRKTAAQKKVWEVLRDCDLYEAVISKNSALVVNLYFGTPYESFRKRTLKLFKDKVALPQQYIWQPAGKPEHENHLLEVAEGRDLRSGAKLKAGQLVHKLLQILSSDFYRPFKVQALFGFLFLDEFYNFLSSPHKVYDLIARLRDWFKDNDIPIEVASTARGEFQLKFLKPYALKVNVFTSLQEPVDGFSQMLKNEFSEESFTCKDVVTLTGYSRAQAKRYLRDAVESGRLVVGGKGNSTRYKVTA